MEKKFIFVLSSRQNKRFSVRICRNLIFEFISTVSNRKCGEIGRSRKLVTYGYQQIRLPTPLYAQKAVVALQSILDNAKNDSFP